MELNIGGSNPLKRRIISRAITSVLLGACPRCYDKEETILDDVGIASST